jgi:hypothetical protein
MGPSAPLNLAVGAIDNIDPIARPQKCAAGFFLETTMPAPIIKFFAYEHLPKHLQEVSKPIGDLASEMDAILPDGAEKSAGLRKLLEAKDCLVRARLEQT